MENRYSYGFRIPEFLQTQHSETPGTRLLGQMFRKLQRPDLSLLAWRADASAIYRPLGTKTRHASNPPQLQRCVYHRMVTIPRQRKPNRLWVSMRLCKTSCYGSYNFNEQCRINPRYGPLNSDETSEFRFQPCSMNKLIFFLEKPEFFLQNLRIKSPGKTFWGGV